MKNKKIFVMTSSGPVPFDKADIPQEDRVVLAGILRDIFQDSKELEEARYGGVMSIDYYIHKIAVRNDVRYHDIDVLLRNLWLVQPGEVIQVLARAIAMEMDMNYPDHINTINEGYIIDNIIGEPVEVTDLQHDPKFSYRNCGLFRNKDDASTALEILKPLINIAYGGKQKDKGSN